MSRRRGRTTAGAAARSGATRRSSRATCFSGPRVMRRRRHALVRLPGGDDAVQTTRHASPVQHPLLPRLRAGRLGHRGGANLVNVHHATAINPYINYPFLETARMRAYADSRTRADAHQDLLHRARADQPRARRSGRCARSATEVLSADRAAAISWLQEHIGSRTTCPAWYVPALRDVAHGDQRHLALAQLLRRGAATG